MEAKKNPKADVYQQRPKFFLIGLITSISLLIMAFEWQTEKTIKPKREYSHDPEVLLSIPSTHFEQQRSIVPSLVKAPVKINTAVTPSSFAETKDNDPTIETDPYVLENETNGNPVAIEPDPEPAPEEIFLFAENQPEPVGGLKNFYETISRNIKYPMQAKRNEVEGKVVVEFVVDKLGQITNLKISNGIGAGCDEEAMRVIALTKWNAGKQRGRPVNVRMIVPIYFKLN